MVFKRGRHTLAQARDEAGLGLQAERRVLHKADNSPVFQGGLFPQLFLLKPSGIDLRRHRITVSERPEHMASWVISVNSFPQPLKEILAAAQGYVSH